MLIFATIDQGAGSNVVRIAVKQERMLDEYIFLSLENGDYTRAFAYVVDAIQAEEIEYEGLVVTAEAPWNVDDTLLLITLMVFWGFGFYAVIWGKGSSRDGSSDGYGSSDSYSGGGSDQDF
ncbi:hypothetical protein I6G82_18170 [Lysinibacillus macroides]|uniref:TPM domain-containing protein n=1 Tax=Lysinibacillus macroides TaxID=33935 RepID=A0A0N0CU96_9BACI|nr:hypothetical protein [Lysinibacillus macroides]KOY79895.1 hypothetical protein ADM90_21990 [Lysinibacillus macroides]QPR67144.1 hypothetical protein I6G82_18170 [Lysinibacillus macroides]